MYKNITLEMSLKPFKETGDLYIENVCRKVFEQWKPLVKDSEVVSVMLWTADGSEILDYDRNLEKAFEWCYTIGGANCREVNHAKEDPQGIGLHSRSYPYMKNPPVMTYGILKKIVAAIKKAGNEMLPNKRIRVGETFDPGPEFAKSDFKYKYHNEICGGNGMGKASMVNAASCLNGDSRHYAAFPDGIPDKTTFGTFFGKQCEIFLKDMDFDYIWFSNGLGFGREVWSTEGDIFDGKSFHGEKLKDVVRDVFKFWIDFRKECPDFPIETRGTNMSMGIDYATDGVPLKKIYDGVTKLLPPPNSPWAALNFDYGLELMGHMSRIAEIPSDEYLFRYYIHDPWWANSPWYDRYESLPNDIYLPMALARIDKNSNVCPPTNLNLLSIDNSYGDMPDGCVYEPLPHLVKAAKEAPDAPSPLVWVYPFREYNGADGGDELSEMFSGDWFIRNAINAGLPLSTVVSTDNFILNDKNIYSASILISPVPENNGRYEEEILNYIENGGKVVFYGSVTRSSDRFRNFIGVELTDGICGEIDMTVLGKKQKKIKHDPILSGGMIDTKINSLYVNQLAAAADKTYGTYGKNFAWIRATNSSDYTGGQLLKQHSRTKYYRGEELILDALKTLGFLVEFERFSEESKPPVTMIHRHNNAFIYSVYAPDTTVEMHMKTELGIPALSGGNVLIKNGVGIYRFSRFERRECRVFIEQENGIVNVKEWPPVSYQYRRRIKITGLKNATVRFFSEEYCKASTASVVNSVNDFYIVGDAHDMRVVNDKYGTYCEAVNISGEIVFSMPVKE